MCSSSGTLAASTKLKRDGELVAGDFSAPSGHGLKMTHTACMTPDGVLLRLVVDGKTTVEARAITYHQQPPELFQVPKGYQPALAPEGAHEP